jgi:uncharacterized protein (UPF0276 family)
MFMPGSELTEAQFLAEVLEKADCGLLLDVNNVYVNSLNHKFDPYHFIDQLPLERVVQVHIAGHSKRRDIVIDTHGSKVIDPVYDLLKYALERTDARAVMLERDQNYPEFSELIGELDQIRKIVDKAQPKLCSKRQLSQSNLGESKSQVPAELATTIGSRGGDRRW